MHLDVLLPFRRNRDITVTLMGNIMQEGESQSLGTILKYNIEFPIAGESRGTPSITRFCWIGALLLGLLVDSVPL